MPEIIMKTIGNKQAAKIVEWVICKIEVGFS